MLADYHVHTAFSNDSVYPMEDVVKDAISLGMEDICFTDHVDYIRIVTGTTQEGLNIVQERKANRNGLRLPT